MQHKIAKTAEPNGQVAPTFTVVKKENNSFAKMIENTKKKAKLVHEWELLNEHCKELSSLQFTPGTKSTEQVHHPQFKIGDSLGIIWQTSNSTFINKVKNVMAEAIQEKMLEKQIEIEQLTV